MRDSYAQLGIDEDQLAAGDEAAVGRELDRCSTVPIQLDNITWLDAGQLSEREVNSAQLDRQGHRNVEWTNGWRRCWPWRGGIL